MIRNRFLNLALACVTLSFAGSFAATAASNCSNAIKATAQTLSGAINTDREQIIRGASNAARTPYLTKGNRTQRKRQLAGMLARNGVC